MSNVPIETPGSKSDETIRNKYKLEEVSFNFGYSFRQSELMRLNHYLFFRDKEVDHNVHFNGRYITVDLPDGSVLDLSLFEFFWFK